MHIYIYIYIYISTTTLGQSGPENNSNEGVVNIPQRSHTSSLPIDCLLSHLGHILCGGAYSCANMQLVDSIALTTRAQRYTYNMMNISLHAYIDRI